MSPYRRRLINQKIRELSGRLERLNSEVDRHLRPNMHSDRESGNVSDLVKAGLRACALARVIRELEHRLAKARERLISAEEQRFHFRRRLHMQLIRGGTRYHFWKA